ncbi:hypothetical protein BS50DRAFT_576883 [Corynespora cassiicola Philippines]|uniref:Ubiquitin-like domain-containing protein n=1 Tax=Corynespora cassiicola Philippines TaxID=1448308 RepID=A0A2T2NC93_CORCC|nr:hypothetical protein BS50DRAFT_576883 [Corynespora cassiicola Philippines]
MMEKVVRSSLEMYSMLHTIHTSILRSPSYDPADTFRFEDALGRSRRLPYEYFRRVEIFNAFLAAEFQDVPGEKKISDRQYITSKEDSEGYSIKDEEWSVTVFPGSSIIMAMLVASFTSQAQENRCPRSGCSGYGQRVRRQTFLRCIECNVEYAAPLENGRVHKEPFNWLPMTRESTSRPSSTLKLNSPTNANHTFNETTNKYEDFKTMQKNQDAGVQMRDQAIKELEVFRIVHLQDMHAYWLSLSALRDSDKSFYELYDFNYVREKFPSAPMYLSIRLGKANTGRRHYFAYCQENFQRLGRESKIDFPVTEIYEGSTMSIAGTVKSNPVRIPGPPLVKGAWTTCAYCYRTFRFEGYASWR